VDLLTTQLFGDQTKGKGLKTKKSYTSVLFAFSPLPVVIVTNTSGSKMLWWMRYAYPPYRTTELFAFSF
jgi:hypothetical protein